MMPKRRFDHRDGWIFGTRLRERTGELTQEIHVASFQRVQEVMSSEIWAGILVCTINKGQTRRRKRPKEYYLIFVIVFDTVTFGQVWSFVVTDHFTRLMNAHPQPYCDPDTSPVLGNILTRESVLAEQFTNFWDLSLA